MHLAIYASFLVFLLTCCHGNEEEGNVKELFRRLLKDPKTTRELVLNALSEPTNNVELSKRQSPYSMGRGGDTPEPLETIQDLSSFNGENAKKRSFKFSDPPPGLMWDKEKRRLHHKKELYRRIINDVNELFQLDE